MSNFMLSRVADSLYWMSRYLERAEHTARVMNVQLDLMLERGTKSDDGDWVRVLRSLGIEPGEDKISRALSIAQSLLNDRANASSIVSCIAMARENARQVREQISSQMWEQVNRLFHSVSSGRARKFWQARDFLESIKEGAHLFQGITDSTMTHGQGWQFIQAGRYLERAVSLSMLISVHFREFHRPDRQELVRAYLEWIGLLRSCTAFEAYCKAHAADLNPEPVAEFLILHPTFPHSIRFSVEALEVSIKEIGREVSGKRSARVERIAGRLRATLGFSQIDEIMNSGLTLYLNNVSRQCSQLHSALHQTYISYPIETALEAS